MAMKKLYSFRAEASLLEALRERADKEETTVSELIHRLLSEALGINNKAHKPPVSHQDFQSLMTKLKEEVKAEVIKEMGQS